MKFTSVAIFGLAALVAAAPAPTAETGLSARIVVPGGTPVHLVSRQVEDIAVSEDATAATTNSYAAADTDDAEGKGRKGGKGGREGKGGKGGKEGKGGRGKGRKGKGRGKQANGGNVNAQNGTMPVDTSAPEAAVPATVAPEAAAPVAVTPDAADAATAAAPAPVVAAVDTGAAY